MDGKERMQKRNLITALEMILHRSHFFSWQATVTISHRKSAALHPPLFTATSSLFTSMWRSAAGAGILTAINQTGQFYP